MVEALEGTKPMKEKIAKLRAKTKEARSNAQDLHESNALYYAHDARLFRIHNECLIALVDGLDLMADMFEQLYSEEETEEG